MFDPAAVPDLNPSEKIFVVAGKKQPDARCSRRASWSGARASIRRCKHDRILGLAQKRESDPRMSRIAR